VADEQPTAPASEPSAVALPCPHCGQGLEPHTDALNVGAAHCSVCGCCWRGERLSVRGRDCGLD